MAQRSLKQPCELLLIGGSAGSLEVIMRLLPALHKTMALAVVIVMHRKAGESMLAELLNEKTTLFVKEAEEKERIEPGTVYIAPADYHLLIEKDRTFSLDDSEKIHYSRPAIDVTFETAAEAYGEAVICILLSGANSDGAAGMKWIKASHGLTIVQDPQEASVAYMPEQAIKAKAVDYVLNTSAMIDFLNGLNKA